MCGFFGLQSFQLGKEKKIPKSFKYKDNLENILGWTINPIEKNWTPTIINKIPRKNSGFLYGVIHKPLNQLNVKYKLIAIPKIKQIIPISPKRCIGLFKYFSYLLCSASPLVSNLTSFVKAVPPSAPIH